MGKPHGSHVTNENSSYYVLLPRILLHLLSILKNWKARSLFHGKYHFINRTYIATYQFVIVFTVYERKTEHYKSQYS